ncbi:RrF2 family transcriptional regulator [Futiania mangrovi]|uniref:Rrf2 family transcriptional regulator n=1 Tax=Futiania mangrovi TaxID=2959716 RepID=A0A9J6PP14_9PROT|nr:Rrf2 family transcriptional regulator [Futiania mangrovii]MCP1337834.1 Rrf2 family transcriptional regulator [Futiania mangrovii]
MRLTLHSDYALRTLMYVALAPERLVSIAEIAERYGISRNHLMRVVQELAQKGFLETRPGRAGGMKLAARPETIRLGAVVRDMEPDFALVECFHPNGNCRLAPDCQLGGVLDEALSAFLAVLDRYTVADLIAPANALRARLGLETTARQ